MLIRHLIPKLYARRCYSSTAASSLNINALDSWIALEKSLLLNDTLAPDHLADLYITLPTRDGTRGKPFPPPSKGLKLGYGHHLVFFHPRNPELALRPDGTDADFCPPEPFTRRMWAGGSMTWNSPLTVGETVESISKVSSVEKKGFEKGTPMVFVNQTIEYYRQLGKGIANIVEDRSHVYLPPEHHKREVRDGMQSEFLASLICQLSAVKIPQATSDFSFVYTPSATTLFRFSALTFNGHHIHLDRDYAQQIEGHPG
jgi:hydroxyacyl-ACP dehydratase HTD2-like protein with hotdog domain